MKNPYTPARSSGIFKWILSGGVVVASVVYIFWQNLHGTSTPVPSVAPIPSSDTSATSTAAYTNGSYLGEAVNAYYGIVQVRAIITGGKLTDVQLVQYPNDRSETIAVSNRSLPMLVQEALQVQNAQVHTISGATQTSEGFQASLASALTQARS